MLEVIYLNDFKYDLFKVPGVTNDSEILMVINDKIVCFADDECSAKAVIKYASTLDETVLSNGKIKRLVKKALGMIS